MKNNNLYNYYVSLHDTFLPATADYRKLGDIVYESELNIVILSYLTNKLYEIGDNRNEDSVFDLTSNSDTEEIPRLLGLDVSVYPLSALTKLDKFGHLNLGSSYNPSLFTYEDEVLDNKDLTTFIRTVEFEKLVDNKYLRIRHEYTFNKGKIVKYIKY